MFAWLVLPLSLMLTACGDGAPTAEPLQPREITLTVTAPPNVDTVYLTGNLDSLGPWRADALPMNSSAAGEHEVSLTVPPGARFEYKFTLGNWDREAVGAEDVALPPFILADSATKADHTLDGFKQDVAAYISTPSAARIIGHLDYWLDVSSNHLAAPRNVTIWTPPGYSDDPSKRYRVIYMSDGQNLFDPRIAETGIDWGVDEAMMDVVNTTGSDPAIVVATWSTAERGPEYSPWHDAPAYAAFLETELMARVNASYRTLTGPEDTFHIGGGMGGLLSYYLVTYHSDMFSACGCMSTHFPLSEAIAAQYFTSLKNTSRLEIEPYILIDIDFDKSPSATGRYWFDYGTEGLEDGFEPTHMAVRDWMIAKGKIEGDDLVVRKYDGAGHTDAAWRERLPDVLTFLLAEEPAP